MNSLLPKRIHDMMPASLKWLNSNKGSRGKYGVACELKRVFGSYDTTKVKPIETGYTDCIKAPNFIRASVPSRFLFLTNGTPFLKLSSGHLAWRQIGLRISKILIAIHRTKAAKVDSEKR